MKLNALFLAALLVGCGAAEEGLEDEDFTEAGTDDEAEVSDDIGEVQQAYIANSNGSGGWLHGFLQNASPPGSSCNAAQASTAQCQIPPRRQMTFCVYRTIGGPLGWASVTERNAVRSALAQMIGLVQTQVNAYNDPSTNWSLSVSPNETTCPIAGPINTTIVKGGVGGTLTNLVSDYFGVTCELGSTTLSESPAIGGVVKAHGGGCGFTLDSTDIANKGANATEDDLILKRALTKGSLQILGVGNTNASHAFATNNEVAPANAGFSVLTSGQTCRLDTFVDGSAGPPQNTTFFWGTSSPCANN